MTVPSRPRPSTLLGALVLSSTLACSGGEAPATGGGERSTASGTSASPDAQLLRERSAALWIESRKQDALDTLRPLLEREDAAYEDLLNGGILEFSLAKDDGQFESALELLRRASAAAPDRAAPHYVLGTIQNLAGNLEAALASFREAQRLDPDDYPTRLFLANVLQDLDRLEEAEAIYRELMAIGVDEAGGWHLSTMYRLGQQLSWEGEEEGQRLLQERKRLEEAGLATPSSEAMRVGNLGEITWPRPQGLAVAVPAPSYAVGVATTALPAELAGMRGLAAWTVFENWERLETAAKDEGEPEDRTSAGEPTSTDVGLSDLGAWGEAGLVLALREGDGWRTAWVTREPVTLARAADFDNDADLDFLVVGEDGVRILATSGGRDALAFTPLGEMPELPGAPRDVQPVDYDHEGDVDVLLVGDFGARLWRNDGFTEAPDEAAWTDATAEARLPRDRAFDWCVIEDFDTDQDVDLLLGGANGVFLADSLRGGVFGDRSADLASVEGLLTNEPLVADLNGDAWPDLWIPSTSGSSLVHARPSGRFEAVANGPGVGGEVASLSAVDLDADGFLDAGYTLAGGSAGYVLAIGAGADAPPATPLEGQAFATAWDDFDGDGTIDLARTTAEGATVETGDRGADSHSIRLAIRAEKRDNRRGLGAIVELRAGPVYRRVYWTGEPVTLGLGAQDFADIVRVTWPRGVEQHDFDVPAGSRWSMTRVERVEGSCPFLYTWNGESYEFVTDVLGITPLGLPMAPGQLVPPDHDEYVLVRGEQLVPREEADGSRWFDMQFTEELREVTYLDRIRLDVVDHPVGTEVFPNERFSFPPFPEAHTHVMRDPLVPLTARDDRGNDWTGELAAIDGDYAIPFEAHDGLLTGLAKPHTLELAFDAEAVRDADLLRLVCTGWFLWSDASINVAAARTPGVDFVPPMLQVPDPEAEGGWRATGPPVGFPAGKRKTMVLDVTELLNRDDPRIRIFGTLCLYWDSIRLATDADDEPLVTTSIEPVSAELWERGFSRSLKPLAGHMLEWFDWDELDEPRWNQHPGRYTRYGETVSLLGEIDDRYVIMGTGDALRVRFPADGLPELPEGWRRDYLVFLDGWAKDRDPNTLEALYVTPLPFHGMSGYPYGDDEAFPDTEAHRTWRREWNTRPAKRWIEPLAPGRVARSEAVPIAASYSSESR